MIVGAKDAAEYLGVPRQVVTELAKKGFLAANMVAGAWIFNVADLHDFISRNNPSLHPTMEPME